MTGIQKKVGQSLRDVRFEGMLGKSTNMLMKLMNTVIKKRNLHNIN